MSRRVLGLLSFAVGLAALLAGFQVVALGCAGIGFLFIASTASPGVRGKARASGSTSYGSGAEHISDSGQCDTGSSSGDCGGGSD